MRTGALKAATVAVVTLKSAGNFDVATSLLRNTFIGGG